VVAVEGGSGLVQGVDHDQSATAALGGASGPTEGIDEQLPTELLRRSKSDAANSESQQD
jgi:hypothetical protein